MKFNYDVKLSETDIKIAIARYVGEMIGVKSVDPKDITITHATEWVINNNIKELSTMYAAEINNKLLETSNLL